MIFKIIYNFIKYKILGITSDIKTDKLKINFIKKNNRWYADLPNWTGAFAQLEMVCGADILLEELSNEGNNVTLEVSTQEFDDSDKLIQIHHDKHGAMYRIENDKYITPSVWLCNVTHFVLGEHPKEIYFKVCK